MSSDATAVAFSPVPCVLHSADRIGLASPTIGGGDTTGPSQAT